MDINRKHTKKKKKKKKFESHRVLSLIKSLNQNFVFQIIHLNEFLALIWETFGSL